MTLPNSPEIARRRILELFHSVNKPSDGSGNGMSVQVMRCEMVTAVGLAAPTIPEVNAMRVSSMLSLSIFSLVALSAVPPCAAASAIAEMRPDFLVTTASGRAAVSIREAPPGMTLEEFERTVKSGMESALAASVEPAPAAGPFPERRIVWHVDTIAPRAVSNLIVNVFDGSVPFAYEQQEVDNGDSADVVTGVVRSLTRRLIAAIERHDQAATRPRGPGDR